MKKQMLVAVVCATVALCSIPAARAADADVTGLVPTIWWDFETKPGASGLPGANKGSASISFTSEGTATYQAGFTNGWAVDTSKFTPYSGAGSFSTKGNPFTLSLVMTLGTKENGITLNLRTTAGDLIIRRGAEAGSLVIGLGPQKAASTKFLNATFAAGDTAFHLVSIVAEQSGTSLYVDGNLVTNTTEFTLWSESGCASQMQFGSHLDGTKTDEAKYGGCIDDLRIHDAALTPAQMKAIATEYGIIRFIGVQASGEPSVGKDSFSVPWSLLVGPDDVADAAIVYGTDASLSTLTTNAIGSALSAGRYTASLTGLAPSTTYWWKIVASNGVEWAESEVASFRTFDPAAFTKRIPITISGYGGTETLTNFPVLVKLAAGAPAGFDYAECVADGSDIRFADADGTVLAHEIESWDPNGISYVWVRVPFLAGTTTQVSLYYGAVVTELPAVDSAAVWSRYAAVFHGGATIADATGKSATVNANTVTGAASGGKIGGVMHKAEKNVTGVQFSNPIKSGAMSSATQASVSGWYKRSNSGDTVITAANVGGWGGGGFLALVEGGSYFSVAVSGTHQGTAGAGALTKDVWGHLAFACDGAYVSSYFNGEGIYSGSKGKTISDPGETYWGIGSYPASGTDGFIGDMDEVRFFNGVASADWFKAEYDSMATPASFAVLGAAESANPYVPIISSAHATLNRSDATFSVSLSSISAETAVSVFYSIDGSTFTEIPLGTLAADGALSKTVTGLDTGTYVWYARATTTVSGVTYAPKSTRDTFVIAYAKEPTASYKHFTATLSYAGTPAPGVPVPLRLSEDAIDGFRYADVTETGFECIDAAGNILPWEIDTWDTNGVSLIWVKVPSYADGATVTVRYGGSFANARPAATEVWNGYVGVWHLNDTNSASAYGSYPNSTAASGIDGEKAQTSIADEAGVIGKSVKICDADWKGDGRQLGGVFVNDAGANSPLDLGDTFVVSGWFKHKNQDYYYDKLFGKRKKANNNDTPNGSFAAEISSEGSAHAVAPFGSGNAYTTLTLRSSVRDVWSHLAFVYDGSSCYVYQNGALVGTSSIAPVTDNDARLCFGNLTGGYGNGTGDCAWCGWIDEVRLADRVPTADWLAAEYAAMADTNAVAYGAVASVDMGDPRISAPVVERLSDGTFRVTAEISQNKPVAGSVKCVVGGTEFAMATADASLPATYSVVLSGLPAGTCTATVQAESAGGTVVSRTAASVFHTGALVVSNVADAVEMTLSPGTFRISRADADATGLPAITFDVAFSGPGLAAVEPPTVTTLTIPAGAASVDVSVTPVYTTAVDTDTLLTLSVSGAFVGTPSSGSITIVNTTLDPSVRYVATTGDDENLGITSDQPKKTIAAAISSLDAIVQTLPCTVHVAPGLYPISNPIVITNAIRVLGTDADPSGTIVANTAGAGWESGNHNHRVFVINHVNALVANLTMQNGSSWGESGSSFYIQSNGGIVSNCVVEAGETAGNGASCGGGLLAAGLVSHCIFRKCTVGSGETSDGNVNYRPAVLWLLGSSAAENCLFVDNTQYAWKALSLVKLEGNSSMRNCTIADSGLGTTNDQCAVFAPLYIHSSNVTVQNVVVVGVTNRVDGELCCPAAGHVSRFINGATDADISGVGFAEDTVTGTAAEFFEDYANGGYTPSVFSPLANAGVEYEGMAATDLAGNPRKFGKGVDIGCYECQKTPGLFIFVR